MTQNDPITPRQAAGFSFTAFGALAMLIMLVFGGVSGCKTFLRYQERSDREQHRSQALKDAQNEVRLSEIEISNQGQRVKIAQQKAQIRKEDAIGIREAQDEISKTLTPLYVQFEMVDALKEIAKSGQNSSVIYIPSGANGIPLIADATAGAVGAPTP